MIFESMPDDLVDQDDMYPTDLGEHNSYMVFVPESAWDQVESGEMQHRAFRRILKLRRAPSGDVA